MTDKDIAIERIVKMGDMNRCKLLGFLMGRHDEIINTILEFDYKEE